MKKLISLLLKKRFKVLKNKKGFSLLEVLVAVSIIGIISAIAVPRFQDYRETATLTSTDTTASNLAKAYSLCTATAISGACLTLDDLKINCPICKGNTFSKDTSSGDNSVCIGLEKKTGNKTFQGCIEISAEGKIKKTYGGDFKICYGKNTSSVEGVWTNKIQKCNNDSGCTTGGPAGWTDHKCKGGSTATGVCTTGNCS